MSGDDLDEVDQYSDASRDGLRVAADAFVAAIEQHTIALLGLTGGSSSDSTLAELNDDVQRAAAAWDDAVWNHTGTLAIAVESPDDDDGYEECEEDDLEPETVEIVSVVSRWDLAVVDPVPLIQAARAAHHRMSPEESGEEAAAAEMSDTEIGRALYTLVHEFGEPWFDMPGVELIGGERLYLAVDGADEPEGKIDDDDESDTQVEPDGRLLYSEEW